MIRFRDKKISDNYLKMTSQKGGTHVFLYGKAGQEPELLNFLRRLRIDSKESIPPAYVVWRARYDNPIPTRS
jgi:hypothetical protein